MAAKDRIDLGIVIERRRLDHPWQNEKWRAVSVIPGAPPVDQPRLLCEGDGWSHYHAATLPLEIFAGETDGYRHNLSQRAPVIYVVLRRDDNPDASPFVPFHVTVCPYEAQAYLETGEDTIEPVAMPAAIFAWLQDFVAKHHVDIPFEKRKRKRYDPDKAGFGMGASGSKAGGRNGE
jgi:hypothetical protein